MKDLKAKLKKLIIDALMIEDMEPGEIGDGEPLFEDGLGLDSVDALEPAVEIERVFGVRIPDSEETRAVFTSVDTLSDYIAQHQPA